MPNIFNRDFTGGWQPNADSANSPPNVLPRADNVTLEDVGTISLRQGLTEESDVTTGQIDVVYPTILDGEQTVLSATPTAVYADGVGLGISPNGGGDVAFGSVDGHALISSGTVHSKYDGETVRNWGIATPLQAPTVGAVALASLVIANFSQASAEFTAQEGTISYVTGQDGVASAATALQPAAGTGRAEMTYVFSAPRNLLNFSGSEGGQFDLFEFWFWDLQPTVFEFLQIAFGCDVDSTDHFQENGFIYQFGSGLPPIGLTQPELAAAMTDSAASGDAPDIHDPPPPPPPPPTGDHDDPLRTRREVQEDKKVR